MAGHSKWANIKHRKAAMDNKRGKLFTKLIKEISIAAKEGGDDPTSNSRLRLAIQNAKGANVPKDNIERAVKKGAGTDSADYTEVTYEGYAPNGVAVFVECMTDNIQRTVQNVRSYFNKVGGSLSTNGSLEFIFDRKGIFTIPVPEGFDEDEFTLEIIDAGAEEVEVEDDYITVVSAMEDFGSVQKALDNMGINVENAELKRIPNTTVSIEEEDAFKKVMKVIDSLEDDDDVQKVWHNLEISEAQMDFL
ncbi:YebC/PmpR family DNA-binding transcriptional regulator [Cytophagaceae bacterium ABcell3]|nr:YebC/PmpR family DNA-binding transcriptional regulator [Cytophagaceae bacterium ABcell3]